MAIDLKERPPLTRTVEPVARPARRDGVDRIVAWLVVSVCVGVAAGALAYGLVTAGEDAARAARIQELRAEATVDTYTRAWVARAAGIQERRAQALVDAYSGVRPAGIPAPSRVLVTGTGPGLVWVAQQQAEWADHAITGTGPGLEHLPGPARQEAVVIGTP
jgi:hypothetical protein